VRFNTGELDPALSNPSGVAVDRVGNAVASVASTRERLDLQRYLESIKKADEEQQANIDQSAVQAAIERLKQHPEPEVGYMLVRQTALPAYNVQTAVDAEHTLIA
jgi:hypothetical protein